MDKKTYTLGVLAVMATVLLAANLIATPAARATTTIKDRDYTMATTRGQRGGESLYVIDNRTGQIMTLTIQNNQLTPVAANTLTTITAK